MEVFKEGRQDQICITCDLVQQNEDQELDTGFGNMEFTVYPEGEVA